MDYESGYDRRVNKTEFERRLNKIYVDLYEGQGKDNPSMTSRLALLEDALEKLNSNLNRLVWLVLSVLLAGLVNIGLHLAGK